MIPKLANFAFIYAGFFDPGFGHAESGGQGTRAVLRLDRMMCHFLLKMDGPYVA